MTHISVLVSNGVVSIYGGLYEDVIRKIEDVYRLYVNERDWESVVHNEHELSYIHIIGNKIYILRRASVNRYLYIELNMERRRHRIRVYRDEHVEYLDGEGYISMKYILSSIYNDVKDAETVNYYDYEGFYSLLKTVFPKTLYIRMLSE